MDFDFAKYQDGLTKAVRYFWTVRGKQSSRQREKGIADAGDRGAVTGGAQMDGFVKLIAEIIRDAGIKDGEIYTDKSLVLPGFYRPTKKWDMLVVANGKLLAAIELKSQVGPSFGNNFNNRTEEAVGSACDLWTAYREGIFCDSPQPWLGYLFLLEDCQKSRDPVSVEEPHFEVFPEFQEASYAGRYIILCRKLIRERQYQAAAFLTSSRDSGNKNIFSEPAEDLNFKAFAVSLVSYVAAYAVSRKGNGKK